MQHRPESGVCRYAADDRQGGEPRPNESRERSVHQRPYDGFLIAGREIRDLRGRKRAWHFPQFIQQRGFKTAEAELQRMRARSKSGKWHGTRVSVPGDPVDRRSSGKSQS